MIRLLLGKVGSRSMVFAYAGLSDVLDKQDIPGAFLLILVFSLMAQN